MDKSFRSTFFRTGISSRKCDLHENQSTSWKMEWNHLFCPSKTDANNLDMAQTHCMSDYLFHHKCRLRCFPIASDNVVNPIQLTCFEYFWFWWWKFAIFFKGFHSTRKRQSATWWLSFCNIWFRNIIFLCLQMSHHLAFAVLCLQLRWPEILRIIWRQLTKASKTRLKEQPIWRRSSRSLILLNCIRQRNSYVTRFF